MLGFLRPVPAVPAYAGRPRGTTSRQRGVRLARAIAALCALGAAAPAAWGSMPGARAPVPAPARIEQFETEKQIPKADRAAIFEDYVRVFRAEFERGEFASALALAERATRLYPQLRRPWNHTAAARTRLLRWGPAIEAARFADRARDDEDRPAPVPEESAAGAAYWEGLALYSTQRYSEALPRLHAAAARNPLWAEAQRALAECVFVSGKAADAAPLYARAFELDPTQGTTRDLSYFAEARAATGDVEGGVAALQEALQRAPFEPGLHAKLGDLYRRGSRPVEAYYELLYEILLHGPQSRFAAPALSMQSELVKAATQTRQDPASEEIILVAGSLRSVQDNQLHDALHKLQLAQRDSRAASPVPQFLFADAEERAGLHDKARTTLQALVGAYPGFAPALFLLSDVETAAGRPQAAEQALQRLRDAFPGYWKLQAKAADE